MSKYDGDYIKINSKSVHYPILELYVKHIHSRQDIENDDTGSIMGWDLCRQSLHDYVMRSVEGGYTDEWTKQFNDFVESLFICNICKKVPCDRRWYCEKCDEFVSLGDVMRRLEKYRIEHLVRDNHA